MRLPIAAFGLALTACYATGEGISPPLERVYFPVGLTTDCDARAMMDGQCVSSQQDDEGNPLPGPNYLYVVSSDFDLQFNAGSMQVIDLARVRALKPRECQTDSDCRDGEACHVSHFCVATSGPLENEPCGALGTQPAAERTLVPGPCQYVDLDHPPDRDVSLIHDQLAIGAFATDVLLKYAPEGADHPKRLYIPVRGEASLQWIDLASDGKLACSQSGDPPHCSDKHRVGTKEEENSRGIRMPAEPYAIAASGAGDAVVVSHQTNGGLSLFTQSLGLTVTGEERTAAAWNDGPGLEFVATLPATNAVAVAALPEPAYVREKRLAWLKEVPRVGADPFPPGFLVAYSNAARTDLVRFLGDEPSSPARPYVEVVQSVALRANAVNTASRGVAFDDTERQACEREKCADPASPDCKWCADNVPADVYVTSRSPASLLVGTTVSATANFQVRDMPQFQRVVPMPAGPSRVYVGKVVGDNGKLETRIFVVCYDEKRIVIYDPTRQRIEKYIATGRGPHAMAFDFWPGDDKNPARALAYVGHFLDSYLGVIELDRRNIRTFGNIVLSLAPAVPPRASK